MGKAVQGDFARAMPMASPWRRRRTCLLVADDAAPAALRAVSGAGALVETAARPVIGQAVELHHPEAGRIRAEVAGISDEGVMLRFARDAIAVAFALTAIGADMSRLA